MKKFDITVSLGIIILCVLLMIFVGLRSRDGDGTVPSYRFLDVRSPINCEKTNSPDEDRRYTYSLEADFNDVCSKADAELIPAGFVGKTFVDKIPGGNKYTIRYYCLKGRFPRGTVWIYIYKHRQYIELPDSKEGAFCEKDGWVMVEIVYGRGWRWRF